ncbi:MAG: hypothetical protein JSV83_02085 [Desulfobacterales bacterium]|nr:MAG: hypothetical protein JSV83_02085 [Desulfobacterales bacterium]
MNKTDCKFERVSNVTIGFFLLIIGVMFTLISIMIIPVIGLLVAIPVLIISGIFLAAPRSKACALIAQKTRGALNN